MNTESTNERYVTVGQIARRLGKQPRTVQRLMQKGDQIPHILDYRKVDPSKPNSAYIARPRKSFYAIES